MSPKADSVQYCVGKLAVNTHKKHFRLKVIVELMQKNVAPNHTHQAAHALKCFKFSCQMFPFCPSFFFNRFENFCNVRTAKKMFQDQLFNSQF